MDRSFLSHNEVVAASRSFVCIRLSTYENEEEAKLLKSIFIGYSGELENTTFTMLDPEGKRSLVAPGRSPSRAFRGNTDAPAREMAATMREISAYYKKPAKIGERELTLPSNGAPRLALNVASCDNLPLVALHAPTAAEREKLEKRLSPLAWSADLAGRAVYTTLDTPGDLKLDRSPGTKAGFTVIGPDAYGQAGTVLAELSPTLSDAELKKQLIAALDRFTPVEKDTRSHIHTGRQSGVYWKTVLPVTDPGPPNGRRPPRP